MKKVVIRRVLISLVLGIMIGLAISEITFRFVQETARLPQEVRLVILAGTAAKVARGEQPPSIPPDMTFVLGDTLVVVNEDEVDHELGPLWIPPGASARLQLDSVENYALSCSFQPNQYLGLDVREPLTFGTRLLGILTAGVPLGGLIAVYSLAAWPAEKKDDRS
ncbi:MAG: hypothetical protein JXA13_13385 [Anaerolineales bacterium]|nr:hypothetical protein [Anaerolineales bacterium]